MTILSRFRFFSSVGWLPRYLDGRGYFALNLVHPPRLMLGVFMVCFAFLKVERDAPPLSPFLSSVFFLPFSVLSVCRLPCIFPWAVAHY